MAVEVAERLMSAEAYLEWESEQPFRNELIDNRIYPMPGGSRAHEYILARLVYLLIAALMDWDCEVYAGGMQVKVDRLGTYTYPDVTVVTGEPAFRRGAKAGPLENPTLLFEVLSPSTEAVDRNQKLEQYKRIPSLAGYFLVAQDKPLIEAHLREGDGWRRREHAGLEARLGMPGLDCEIALREVYRRVDFAEA